MYVRDVREQIGRDHQARRPMIFEDLPRHLRLQERAQCRNPFLQSKIRGECRLDAEYAIPFRFEIREQSPVVRPDVDDQVLVSQRRDVLALPAQFCEIFALHSSRSTDVGIVRREKNIPAQHDPKLNEAALRAVERFSGKETFLSGPLADGIQPVEGRDIPKKYYRLQVRRTTNLTPLYHRAIHQVNGWRMNLLRRVWPHAGLCQRFRGTISQRRAGHLEERGAAYTPRLSVCRYRDTGAGFLQKPPHRALPRSAVQNTR